MEYNYKEPHLLLCSIAQYLELDIKNFSLNLLQTKTQEDKVITYGLNSVYVSPITGTRLMMVFSSNEFTSLPVDLEKFLEYPVLDESGIERTVNLFGAHPDLDIMNIIGKVITHYYSFKYEIRTIPWRDLQPLLLPGVDPDKIEGAILPIIHIVSYIDNETIFIMPEIVPSQNN